MKILHVFHHADLQNGVDRTTLTLIKALRAHGVEVQCLVPEPGDVSVALDALGVPYRTHELGCCAGPAKMTELNYLSTAAQRAEFIGGWLAEEAFDVVHLNTGHLIDAAIAAARARVPALWHIHAPFDIDYARYQGFMGPAGYGWLLGTLGSHVIAVSDDVRRSLLAHVPAADVSTLYNGIDLEDLDTRAATLSVNVQELLGVAESTPVVIGVGRISEQKDFKTFVRVAQRVCEKHSQVCFAIVGPAEDRGLTQELEQQITALGLAHRVQMLGPRSDVPGLLRSSSLLLSTAIFEGQGLAALEAMALRKPVVAMDCVGLRECIEDGVDGLLVSLGDEAAAAAAVLGLLNDATLAENLGARGRETVSRRFSSPAYAEGFLAIAEQLRGDQQPDRRASAAGAEFALGMLKEVSVAHTKAVATQSPGGLRRLFYRLRRGLNVLLTGK